MNYYYFICFICTRTRICAYLHLNLFRFSVCLGHTHTPLSSLPSMYISIKYAECKQVYLLPTSDTKGIRSHTTKGKTMMISRFLSLYCIGLCLDVARSSSFVCLFLHLWTHVNCVFPFTVGKWGLLLHKGRDEGRGKEGRRTGGKRRWRGESQVGGR